MRGHFQDAKKVSVTGACPLFCMRVEKLKTGFGKAVVSKPVRLLEYPVGELSNVILFLHRYGATPRDLTIHWSIKETYGK